MMMYASMAAALQSVGGLPYSPAVMAVAAVALVIASLVMVFVKYFKRCPANQVLVISGKVGTGQSAKIISGGGTFVVPVLQEWAFLDLTPLQIDINLMDALSLENIRVQVPSQVTVAVGDTEEYQRNAGARILNLSPQEISAMAANLIFGQMRQVIASMRIEDINRDRDQFRSNIEHALEPELKKIGLKLINVNIKDLNDSSGYIEAIGREAGARAVNKAKGDVAVQEKLGAIAVAQANQEKDTEVANAERTREIGVKTAERDTSIRIADLDREKEVAQQRAQFSRDTEIAAADQDRRIAVAAANAQAIEGEAQAQARIAAANAELQVAQAASYEQGETRKRIAEAAVQEAENRARAKAALAEAERIENERRAALEAPARAAKAKEIVEAEAAGQSRRIQAEAEAAATYAQLEAAARGDYEMLSKKAEGLKRIVDACGGPEAAYRMLMLEHVPVLADKAAEAISNIKFDKVVLWGGAGTNGAAASGVSSFVTDLMGTLPPALHTMLNIGGVSVADGLFKVHADADDVTPATPAPPTSTPMSKPTSPPNRVPPTERRATDLPVAEPIEPAG
jgi:flotillin